MTNPALLSLDKVFLELRFPPSLLYQDYPGTIAHSAQAVFPPVELTLGEILVHEGNVDDPRMRLSPATAWFSPIEGTKFDDFLRWVRPVAERALGEIMAVEKILRVGVRAYSILAMPTVEDGVNAFRRSVCDHRAHPFSVLPGEPAAVRFELRLAEWEVIEGSTFDLTAFVAPLKLPESARARLGGGEEQAGWEGGLLVDLDAGSAEGQTVGIGAALELAQALSQRLSATVDVLVDALMGNKDGLQEGAAGD
jgi:hypothetical protein